MHHRQKNRGGNIPALVLCVILSGSATEAASMETPLFLSDYLNDILFNATVPDSTPEPRAATATTRHRFRSGLSYFSMYSYQKTVNDTPAGTGNGFALTTDNSYRFSSPVWYVRAFFRSSRFDASILDYQDRYGVSLTQDFKCIGMEVRRRFLRGEAGARFSNLLTGDGVGNGLFSHDQMNYGMWGRLRIGVFSLLGAADRFQDHRSLLEIRQLSDEGVRTFPLVLSHRRLAAGTGVHWPSRELVLRGEMRYTDSRDLIDSRNALQNRLRAVMRKGELAGSTTIAAVRCEGRGWIHYGGGYLEGYDAMEYNYMLMDSLSLINGGARLSASGLYGMAFGLFGERWDGKVPYGFLSMAPFSSWALFYPLKYRFTDVELRCSEAGAYLEKIFAVGGNQTLRSMLAASHISGMFTGIRQQRTIAVLMPYYTNTIRFTNFHVRGVLLSMMVDYSVRIGGFLITASCKQFIPFMENLAPEPDRPSTPVDPTQPVAIPDIREKMYGGTFAEVKAAYDF